MKAWAAIIGLATGSLALFAEGTSDVVKGFRYVPPRLGSQSVGCTGQTINVAFRLPD